MSRTITTRSAAVITAVVLAVGMLLTAGLFRVLEPARAEFVPALTPAPQGPAVMYSGQAAWRVPGQVAPGLYNVYAVGDRSCTWQRLKNFTGAATAVLQEGEITRGSSKRVQVYATDRGFRTMGPCEWESLL